ncbi:7 transmembrane receptor (rhodopsin family) domain-containing protein [Ditylenchus destructor]|nr:7 transmembrane receptor (rhodopsin family) domain-containing protein [Ditylenchus destructor]
MNESSIIDTYGLLSDCEKIKIANELTELRLQTRTNHSSDACEREGLRGVVIVIKNESAVENAAKAFFTQMIRNFSRLHFRFNCKNIFVLVYSYETAHIGLTIGDDSLLNQYDANVILAKQLENDDGSRWVDFISGLITSIQTGAVNKQDMTTDTDYVANLLALFFLIALVVGFSGNVLCIVTISFTKLIQNPFNKYLLVLLISDTLFILWLFATATLYVTVTWFTEVENRHFLTCALLGVLVTNTMCAGSTMLVLLTMERFFAIVFPIGHMQYGHINRWIIILLALLPMQLYSIYYRLVRPYFDPESFTIFENGKCYYEGIFRFQLNNIPFHIFIFVIPLLVVIFVNVVITIKLRQRRNSKTSSNNANGSNETLWILPITYTGLTTPLFIVNFVKQFFYATTPSFSMDFIENVTKLMFVLDFFFNWVFYAITSSSFRKTFISFWPGICRKSRGAPKIDTSNTRDNSNSNTTESTLTKLRTDTETAL